MGKAHFQNSFAVIPVFPIATQQRTVCVAFKIEITAIGKFRFEISEKFQAAVTANAFAEDIAETSKAGMDAHISKPIDFGILCRTLEKLISEKSL